MAKRSPAPIFGALLLAAVTSLLAVPVVGTPTRLEDVVIEQRGDVTFVTVPSGECSNVTSTPVVARGYLMLPMHDRSLDCSDRGPYGASLLGYRFSNEGIYELARVGGTEATLTYEPGRNRVYWPVLAEGAVRVLNGSTFRVVSRRSGIESVADSAGTALGGLFYFGTVNTPFPTCQNPASPNPDCGAVYGVDRRGRVKRRLDVDDGYRAWVTGAPTSDGTHLYAGGGNQNLAGDDLGARNGCSTVKVDRRLRLVAAADPGDPGCRSSGRGGDDEDAVAGEPVLGPDSVWVQYTNPNTDENAVRVYRYDRDLVEQCSASFPTLPARGNASSYYQAPTVDAQGNAYVALTLVRGGSTRGELYRISPQCAATRLASDPGQALAAPTLVDDDAILLATAGRLRVLELDGTQRARYALASNARVLAAPVLHEGVVYVFAEDSTLTVLRGTGLRGYGNAAWPRFRGDNAGSARASS